MLEDEALVTVATFKTVFEASLAKGALESIGIAASVPEEMLVRAHGSIMPIARLQVFASQASRAQIELRRMQIRLVDDER